MSLFDALIRKLGSALVKYFAKYYSSPTLVIFRYYDVHPILTEVQDYMELYSNLHSIDADILY